ncbi:hypothetical protein BKA70DRAFT_1436075 [Coprinopsis sp. MPI-PUGE-AT-0042]|nr:hypothetical protein BKA70DRAFT_1436075 [Coprinopsis sp. MPI-PUGE-AT-0042]
MGLESTTTEVSQHHVPGDQADDPDLCLIIDTPGFGNCGSDGLKSDCKILEEVERFLMTRHPQAEGKCAIVMLHSVHAAEVNWEGQEKTMAMFKKLAGDPSFRNIVAVNTSQHEGVTWHGANQIWTPDYSRSFVSMTSYLYTPTNLTMQPLALDARVHGSSGSTISPLAPVNDHNAALAEEKGTEGEHPKVESTVGYNAATSLEPDAHGNSNPTPHEQVANPIQPNDAPEKSCCGCCLLM